MMIRSLVVGLAWGFAGLCLAQAAGQDSARQPAPATDLFADENLTAWLVMFTDPVRRTPHERAAMLQRLGFGRVGFEAFDKYVPLLEQQMEAYGRQGIEVTCVYVVINTATPSREAAVRTILDVLRRRRATPDIWAMFPRNAYVNAPAEERRETMIRAFSDLAKTVNEAGCRLALYNYGSWFGAVDVQLEIMAGVRERTGVEIGTVFNFHRGHQHMKDFPEALERLRPHLMAVNLNGMNLADAGTTDGNAKILPLGEGDYELTMMKQLLDSGYNGPIGIIDHRDSVDAEQALRANLDGLKKLRSELLQSRAGR